MSLSIENVCFLINKIFFLKEEKENGSKSESFLLQPTIKLSCHATPFQFCWIKAHLDSKGEGEKCMKMFLHLKSFHKNLFLF